MISCSDQWITTCLLLTHLHSQGRAHDKTPTVACEQLHVCIC